MPPDPQSTESGFLTMADVFGLRLNADLVTLSACNTGRGKAQRGEGIMELTRAFTYAGTPAVSVTLWSVKSYSAKDLNAGLFRNLRQGKSPAQALRDIKLSMLRGDIRSATGGDWGKPRYWATVVVFGAQNFSDQAVAPAGAESAKEPVQPVKSAQTETVTDSNQQVKTGKTESAPEPAPEPVNPAITRKPGAASCFISTAIGEE
ncbi:MAG: CHAT domain-containing protein [Desulfobacterales bacterium]